MDLKKVRTGMVWSIGAAAVCYLISQLTNSDLFFGLLVIALGAFLFFAVCNLCPHCSQPLWGRDLFPTYCPHCGKHLLPTEEGETKDEQK